MGDASKTIDEGRARALLGRVAAECQTRSSLDRFAESYSGPEEERDFLKHQVIPYLNANRTFGINEAAVDDILTFIYRPRRVA